MEVKFSRCNSNNLTNIPVIDGQLIIVKDNSECYLDIGTERIRIEDKILINQVISLETSLTQYKESIDEQLNTHTNEITQLRNDLDTKIGDISTLLDIINGSSTELKGGNA